MTSLETGSLPWTHALVIAPYQTRIGIRTNSEHLLNTARSFLLPGWSEQAGDEADYVWSIFQDSQHCSLLYGERLVSQRLDIWNEFRRYFHLYVGATARNRTFLHAGVVGLDNLAVILPGSSSSGKSTLTKALLELGGVFYSDDLAALDESGLVHAYPKPLSIRTPNGPRLTMPQDLGWSLDLPPLKVGMVAHLSFSSQIADPSWRTLSPAQACAQMIANCLSFRTETARDLACFKLLASQAIHLLGVRGEAAPAAALLESLLKGR